MLSRCFIVSVCLCVCFINWNCALPLLCLKATDPDKALDKATTHETTTLETTVHETTTHETTKDETVCSVQ